MLYFYVSILQIIQGKLITWLIESNCVIQSIQGHPNLIIGWKILLPLLHFLRRWNYFHSLKNVTNIILLKAEQVLSPETVSLALGGKQLFSANWYAKNLASLGLLMNAGIGYRKRREAGPPRPRQWWITPDPGDRKTSQGWECIINWNPCLLPPCRPLYNCISTLKTIFCRIHNESGIFQICRKEMCFTYMKLPHNVHITDTESLCLLLCVEHSTDAGGLFNST